MCVVKAAHLVEDAVVELAEEGCVVTAIRPKMDRLFPQLQSLQRRDGLRQTENEDAYVDIKSG